jgi:hypothetical protein
MGVSKTRKVRAISGSPKDQLAIDRIVPFRWRHYSLFVWFLIAAILTGFSVALAWPMKDPWPFLGLCFPLAAAVFVVPLAFTFCCRWLIEWSRGTTAFAQPADGPGSSEKLAADEWLIRQLSFFSGSFPMCISGAIMSLLALTAYKLAGYPIGHDGLASIFAAALLAFSAFLAGIGVHAIFCATRMIWRFGEYQITVKNHKFGILSTGRVLVRCYFVIGLVWGIYTSSAVLASPHFDFRMAAIPLLVLAAPAFVAILASFVIGQIPLHNKMVEFKRNELRKVERKLDGYSGAFEDITEKMREDIHFLEAARERILALPEWPFAFTTFLGAIGSSVMPALLSSVVTAAVKLWAPALKGL